jgi:hypothetical protein
VVILRRSCSSCLMVVIGSCWLRLERARWTCRRTGPV